MTRKVAILLSVALLVVILVVIGGIKGKQIGFMMDSGADFVQPPETVSVSKVLQQTWPNTLSAVGSLEAWQGLTITAEVDGRIAKIHFDSGQQVKAGDLLIEQESGNEKALLRASLARLDLAKSNLKRLNSLRDQQSISQSALDEASQLLDSTQAEVDNLNITLAKKRIVAPFAGRLGIRKVNLGQDLSIGTEVVTLQAIEQLRVNFRVPQQWFSKIKPGYAVLVGTQQGDRVNGEIIATAAEINSQSRNLHVQAKIDNALGTLLPGMSVGLQITLPEEQQVLVIPNTAVLYAPYGDTVFVIEQGEQGKTDIVRQQFVKLGSTLGDFVAVTEGLEAGQQVVSAGAFKLFNGMSVVTGDKAEPARSLNPQPTDS
ncbi:efflux RND transporter periplasmic adaptor subunit [uncultured Paraglaciecola sp.]|uniref:efflux RND transporter periplasmic adaptor subunit n=1 Tax=uncultured Paraglaciecola sp. TaxID=1765024 RepID=UPI0030DAA4FB|tara:strand:+ start:95458 stop:96576 length:1119 start_codon:yes stop_codon:yes gene_type:complete